MHASIGGRPVLLADRDIGLRKPIVNTSHPKTTFDVWFAISDLLSTVISFYRPSADPTVGWETDFPSFEELMGDNFGEELDFTMLGTLHDLSRRIFSSHSLLLTASEASLKCIIMPSPFFRADPGCTIAPRTRIQVSDKASPPSGYTPL
jgi:hypothetical protein